MDPRTDGSGRRWETSVVRGATGMFKMLVAGTTTMLDSEL